MEEKAPMLANVPWFYQWSGGKPTVHSGISNVESQDIIEFWITQRWPETLLDIGAGAGRYGITAQHMYRTKQLTFPIHTTAVEVWEPYIKEHNLHKKYDEVICIDARDIENWDYDLVIFGDVLEHMSREDGIKIWNKAKEQARAAIISIPLGHHPQGDIAGNQYECHVGDDWSVEDVLATFDGIVDYKVFEQVGAFLAEF